MKSHHLAAVSDILWGQSHGKFLVGRIRTSGLPSARGRTGGVCLITYTPLSASQSPQQLPRVAAWPGLTKNNVENSEIQLATNGVHTHQGVITLIENRYI